jgi:transposase
MLDKKQRGGIISARKLGNSYRAIAKTIGCHQKTVGRVLALESTPEKIPPKKNIGRPPLIDSEGRERLKALVTDGKRQFTAKALCTAFEEQEGKLVCVKTIRRTLHKTGLHSRIAVRKPFIKEANRVKRLAWCRERQG